MADQGGLTRMTNDFGTFSSSKDFCGPLRCVLFFFLRAPMIYDCLVSYTASINAISAVICRVPDQVDVRSLGNLEPYQMRVISTSFSLFTFPRTAKNCACPAAGRASR